MTEERALARPAGPVADAGEVAATARGTGFERRFLALLERRTGLYAMGDSTSVPAHVAADILRSVCFVLGIDPDYPEVPDALLDADLEAVFRARLADVERRVERTAELWRAVVAAMPPIPNTALRDTVAAIGDFPKLYDFRSMAHEVPCVFDYPLCHPVPETLLGVDYINEYLRRLLIELDFIGRFDPRACVSVLERSSPDYVDLLVNLYEPVATNAIGRALLGIDPAPLRIVEEERVRIFERLRPLGVAERSGVLEAAAGRACEAAGIAEKGARGYLGALARELVPRVGAALAAGDLRGVFV